MSYRLTFTISLLMVIVFSLAAFGAPEFTVESVESSVINPSDTGLTVQEVLVKEFNQSIRIKELTLINLGTASENELDHIQVRYQTPAGNWKAALLSDLTGINSGITFSLPSGGVTLRDEEVSNFHINVNASSPEKVPVSKYGRSISVKLGIMFHYVFLDDQGNAVNSVSSTWYTDPNPDVIRRTGFEKVEAYEVEETYLHPGSTSTLGRYTFKDNDMNEDGVEIDTITIANNLNVNNPLVIGQDIDQLTLEVEIDDGQTVSKKSITRDVSAPASRVIFDLSSQGWWDGKVGDEAEVSIHVKGKVALDGDIRGGLRLKTGLELRTRERNGMTGYPFSQAISNPSDGIQTVEPHGLENITETTHWESGVINLGETYKQRLVLNDQDADSYDFILREIMLSNEGTMGNSDMIDIAVYHVGDDGKLTEVGSGLDFGGSWQNLYQEDFAVVPDQGETTIEIHYSVSPGAEAGKTLYPVVQFRGKENVISQVTSPVHKSPFKLTGYPKGAEIISVNRQIEGKPGIPSNNKLLAQRIDIMDKDENRYDLLINPIVIKNLGTATSAHFTKLEIYSSNGELIAEKEDLAGFNTAGITLDNLDGKTTVKDNQYGNWRSFYIYLTPSPNLRSDRVETIDLVTTLYQSEGKHDFVDKVRGPGIQIKARNSFIDIFTGSSATTEVS